MMVRTVLVRVLQRIMHCVGACVFGALCTVLVRSVAVHHAWGAWGVRLAVELQDPPAL